MPLSGRARRTGVLAALIVLLLVVVTSAVLMVSAALPGPGKGLPVHLQWPGASGPLAASRLLAERGLVREPWLLAAYLWVAGDWKHFDRGPHLLTDSLAARELVQRLARSPARPDVSVTIPEGYNHVQIARRFEQKHVCSQEAFLRAARHTEALHQLGVAGETVEGYLFPATYRIKVNCRPADVIATLVGQMRRRLAKLYRAHPGAVERLRRELGWSEHELLTLASIVEREARHDAERPQIASVYFNRLTDPEFEPARRLQADPTAAYGCIIAPEQAPSCQNFSGRVTPEMLRDPKNRYNTYKHPGLPPGPIASPGEKSLQAVLVPADTDYLFFVAKRDGTHAFSRSFAEHRAAVKSQRDR
jgi:UPF0755 protein